MLNEGATIGDVALQVIEWDKFGGVAGQVNVSDAVLLDNVARAIRRGHPQIQQGPPRPDRVVLLGGGPSLQASEEAIRDLVWGGAKLVTVNGAYHWAIERNLQPRTQIVMDARAHNARFVLPAVPECRYILASQCAPETFDAVADRPHVWLFHAASEDPAFRAILDTYYLKHWLGVGGGTTVICRAINLLRMVGYLRFDLFGVDCCWLEGRHHAYTQIENVRDRRFTVTLGPTDRPDLARRFVVSPWHLKQFENLIQIIRINGEHFLLHAHGDGLFAYALQACAAGSHEFDMAVKDDGGEG